MNKSNSYQPWLIILTASLFFCFIFAQISMFNAISAPLIKSLNLSMTEYGQLSAYYFYGNMIFLIPAGIMLDRLSNTKILITVTALAAIATYGFSVAQSVATAESMRLLTGIAGSFAFITVLRLATKWFKPEKLAGVLGVVVTLAMIGGMIAQAPFVWLTESYGWRNTLLYNSVAGVVITILIALVVKDSPKKTSKKSSSNIAEVFCSLKKALANKQNWLAGITISLLNLPVFVFGATWGSIYLKQIHNMSNYQSSFIISMVFVGMIIGSPISGWFSDRYTLTLHSFMPKLTKKSSRKQPLLLSAIISTVLILFLINSPSLSYANLIVLFFLIGFISSMQVCGYPIITESNPEHLTASASSISSMLIMSGGFVLPLFGWLMTYSSDYTIVNHEIIYSLHDFKLALSILPISYILAGIAALLTDETGK